MVNTVFGAVVVAAALVVPNAIFAGACDYRPSSLLGATASGTIGTTAAGTAATGAGLQAAGFYTLVHSTGGFTMLGSTLAGSSGAGTVGIIGGSGGAVGGAASVIMSPIVIGAAAVTALAGGGFEAVCFFKDERITDYESVDKIVLEIAKTSDNELFLYHPARFEGDSAAIEMLNPDGTRSAYYVENLYLVDGELFHRDRFLNTSLGYVAIVSEVEDSGD